MNIGWNEVVKRLRHSFARAVETIANPGYRGQIIRPLSEGLGREVDTDLRLGHKLEEAGGELYTFHPGPVSPRPASPFVPNPESPPGYEDIRAHVAQHLPPSWADDDLWVDTCTWGEVMRMKSDELHRHGVTGREYARTMWEWADTMERQARAGRRELPFSHRTREYLPYMRTLYRGDSRPPEEIFRRGFEPKGDNDDLLDHLAGDGGDSNYVATSKSPRYAAYYPHGEHGYEKHVYLVEDARGATDVRDQGLGEIAEEHEVVFKGGIPADKIKGVLRDPLDPEAGIIPNPNFRPSG